MREAPLRVLVVDDHRDTVDSLAMLLQSWGHEVWPTYDGPAALAAARAHPPDVVLLDLAMPRLSGNNLAAQLRQLPGMAEALLVCITGLGREEDRRRSREAGRDRHLLKPVDPEELRWVLASGRHQAG
jgi:CheY-like chemotaxis protein